MLYKFEGIDFMEEKKDIEYDLKSLLHTWTMLTLHNKWDGKHSVSLFLKENVF